MSSSAFSAPLHAALTNALRYLRDLDDAPVDAVRTLPELRAALDLDLPEAATSADVVVDELASRVRGGVVNRVGGRFFGWVDGGVLPSALAADWLTATWDQNAMLYAAAPAAVVAEETVGRWLKELLHLPSDASFALVTGSTMAHVVCLAAARHNLLASNGWDVEAHGLSGAPGIRVVTNGAHHVSVNRAVKMLGLGESNIVGVPFAAAANGAADLERFFEDTPRAPTVLVLQAGDVNTGAFDRFASVIPIAKRFGAWVHVDGAFGLWAAASPKYAHLLVGNESADSWAADGHKWLNVPYDSAYVFVRDAAAHRAVFSYSSTYHTPSDEAREPVLFTPQMSRRARAFPTYAAIRELGRSGIAALVERCCDRTRDLVEGLSKLPGAEVLSPPIINQALVRFIAPGGAGTADHDDRTLRIVKAVNESGEAFFTTTSWHDMRAMRVSVCNWQTTPGDVARTIAAVARALTSIS